MTASEIIRNFSKELKIANLGIPIAIEFDLKTCQKLRDDILPMIKHASQRRLNGNEVMLLGILIVGPRNFEF